MPPSSSPEVAFTVRTEARVALGAVILLLAALLAPGPASAQLDEVVKALPTPTLPDPDDIIPKPKDPTPPPVDDPEPPGGGGGDDGSGGGGGGGDGGSSPVTGALDGNKSGGQKDDGGGGRTGSTRRGGAAPYGATDRGGGARRSGGDGSAFDGTYVPLGGSYTTDKLVALAHRLRSLNVPTARVARKVYT